jgi:hypothetical protein
VQELIFGALFTLVCWESPENFDKLVESTLKGEFDMIDAELKAAREQ